MGSKAQALGAFFPENTLRRHSLFAGVVQLISGLSGQLASSGSVDSEKRAKPDEIWRRTNSERRFSRI